MEGGGEQEGLVGGRVKHLHKASQKKNNNNKNVKIKIIKEKEKEQEKKDLGKKGFL